MSTGKCVLCTEMPRLGRVQSASVSDVRSHDPVDVQSLKVHHIADETLRLDSLPGSNIQLCVCPLSLIYTHLCAFTSFVSIAVFVYLLSLQPFLQRVRIARTANRCNSYELSVRLSVRPSVRHVPVFCLEE